MPREIGPIFKRKNNSRRFSNPPQRAHEVKATKFLLLVVPHPLESPSAAAMVRRRKTLLGPSRSRNYSRLPSPKSTPSPEVRSLPELEMRAKLGTPPPLEDSPCPAPKSHCHRTEPFHNPKRIPTRKSRQFEPSRHTPLACRSKTTSQGPKYQAPQGLLFSSTPLPGKPRSKDARRRFGWGV